MFALVFAALFTRHQPAQELASYRYVLYLMLAFTRAP